MTPSPPRIGLRVADVMSRQIVRIRHSSNLLHAAEIFALSGVADLMVVDNDGGFVGVLSVGDVLRAALPSETVAEAGQLFLHKGKALANQPILPLVIRQPVMAAPDDEVAAVAEVLLKHFIGRLPILDRGRLVGTISRSEICWAVVGER